MSPAQAARGRTEIFAADLPLQFWEDEPDLSKGLFLLVSAPGFEPGTY